MSDTLSPLVKSFLKVILKTKKRNYLILKKKKFCFKYIIYILAINNDTWLLT